MRMRLESFNAICSVVVAGAVIGICSADSQAKTGQVQSVVELFTSQGCSSCPPADALLKSYVERPDVLALSYPVDYWDYLGWKDTMASARNSQRQREYAETRGDGAVYTPQAVINGRAHAVGSRRKKIDKAIMALTKLSPVNLPVEIAKEDGSMVIKLGSTPDASGPPATAATVWLAVVQKTATVEIKRGENRGRHLKYYNVVRELSPVGTWTGQPNVIRLMSDAVSMEHSDACAVLVQEGTGGPIIGAAWLDF